MCFEKQCVADKLGDAFWIFRNLFDTICYLLFSVAIIPITLIHTKYCTLLYSYHGCSRKRKRKAKPARPIRIVNHLIIYYIRRRRYCKRRIINFTGSVYFTGSIINFTGSAYIIDFTGFIIYFTYSIYFTGSVYTAYIMKHSLLRKLPGLHT